VADIYIQENIELKDLTAEVRSMTKEEIEERDELLSVKNAINNYRSTDGVGRLRMETLRTDTLRKTALQYGTQMGLHWRTEKLNQILKKHEGGLDSVSFTSFLENGHVLVPSIIKSTANESYSGNTLTKVFASYTVDEEAKIVSAAPTYRDYLIHDYKKPRPVHAALKPRTNDESISWLAASKEGFELGVKQANEIYYDALQEMEMDISGRIMYLSMKALDMIKPAAIKLSENGVTFNGRTMNVGETVLEVTDPVIYTRMERWRSAWGEEGKSNE
jgi:defect-in-organelle-trafficking protein DotC